MVNPNFLPLYSSDEVFRGTNTAICLTDELDRIDSDISALETSQNNYALADHTHEPSTIGAALATHSHYYAELSGMPEALAEKADANHTHDEYASSDHTHSGYADADHTHSEYASASHSHSGYASATHTHSGFADEDHTHSEYFSVNGGTVGGDTNVNGVFRVQGQQAFYYNSDYSSQTIGTNNATGGTTICCGSNATTAINGNLLKTATIVPRASDTYYCGNANFRWKGIYSTSAVNVSSDERMKRDIADIDEDCLMNFIRNLNVVTYNYKDDPENADARIGLIAQDVQKADPEIAKFFVNEDEVGMLGLKPADLVFPLIATVQKLMDKVEELSKK